MRNRLKIARMNQIDRSTQTRVRIRARSAIARVFAASRRIGVYCVCVCVFVAPQLKLRGSYLLANKKIGIFGCARMMHDVQLS